jgi:Zn-dependent protease with chaperone function
VNFFEHQERARASTTKLVLLFVVAILILIVLTSYGVTLIWLFTQQQQLPNFSWDLVRLDIFLRVAAVIVGVVMLAALFRLTQLRSGGRAIAEQMQGVLLLRQDATADERRILNVVEEMALASGLPVPPVYLIPDDAINAFAAGYRPQDAVIGITRGAVRYLKRDELQGVIAHEFSHILNGDMRLNLRLIGWLYGILVLAIVGRQLLSVPRMRSRDSKDQSGNVLLLVGLVLLVLGSVGVFFGNLIKAAVSRQREFLADASSVQFTRYNKGLSNALQKIGGYPLGSRLLLPQVAEISHMMFGDGLTTRRQWSWFATHPDLKERIRRIDPMWRGEFVNPFQLPEPAYSAIAEEAPEAAPVETAQASAAQRAAAASTPTATLNSATLATTLIAAVGEPTHASVEQARAHLLALPPAFRAQLDDLQGASCAIYALLVAQSNAAVARAQLALLQQALPSAEFTLMTMLLKTAKQLAPEQRYTVIELAQPVLRQLSAPQRQIFLPRLQQLVELDGELSFFEWCLQKLLAHHLDAAERVKTTRLELTNCEHEAKILLAAVVRAGYQGQTEQPPHAGNQVPEVALVAWTAACQALNIACDPLATTMQSLNTAALDQALATLSSVKPLQKPKLLKALVACVQHDGLVTTEELQLLRLTSALLDCPMPPVGLVPPAVSS